MNPNSLSLNSLSPAIFYWIVTMLFALGVYLLSRQAFEIAVDLVAGLVGYLRRQYQPGMMRRLIALQEQAGVQPDAKEKGSLSFRLILYSLSQSRVVWIVLGVLAAWIFSDALLSPVALIVIIVGGELFRAQVFSRRMTRLNEDAANLIVQFGSRYPLTRSVSRTLRDAADTLPDGMIRQAVEQSVIRLNMNQNTVEAMKPLRAIAHPVMDRFTSLVADVQDTNQEVFLDTLRLLREDVESRLELHALSRQSLTLVRGTTRALQAVVVAATTAASLLPNWRSYFVASSRNWMLFVGMLVVAGLGSFYVEAELRLLEA